MKLYEHVGVKTVHAEQEADCYEQGVKFAWEMQFHHYRYSIFIVNVSHVYNEIFMYKKKFIAHGIHINIFNTVFPPYCTLTCNGLI